ncbi:interferon-induced 35 kDa protein [Pogona vitticeps]
MESDEDSFIQIPWENIPPSGSQGTATEATSWELKKYQDMARALEMDSLSLQAKKEKCEQEASALQKEVELLHRRLGEVPDETKAYELALQEEMIKRDQLAQEKQALESKLEKMNRLYAAQKELQKVPAALPERSMVFKGSVEEEEKEGTLSDMLTVLPHIRCPIPGGSAVITFESPEVASRIIEMGRHRVQLDDYSYIWVKAEPVTLILPTSLEVSMERSPRQILVSGLPVSVVPEEHLLDKVELFFSKRQNKGGEVERVEWLPNSGHVTLTFVEDGVVERLVQKGQFEVPIGKEKNCKMKVSHYISGQLTNLQVHPSVCAQCVLLSGIPDVLEEDLMREALEVHFQKPSKGGGEVEGIVYISEGRCGVAVFEEAEDEAALLS